MKDVSARLMRYYNIWLKFDKDDHYLIDDAEEVFLISHWLKTKYGSEFNQNKDLRDFVINSNESLGNESVTQFYKRGHCSKCQTPYKKENLSYCVNCKALFCYECVHELNSDAENKWLCDKCGGVLVG